MSIIKFLKTDFPDVFLVETNLFIDERGELTKYFQSDLFDKLPFSVDDVYTTRSSRDVIRGMHHQISPYGQMKLISCLAGAFYDIAVDLRFDSPTYNKIFSYELDSRKKISILIPAGFSHGTYSLDDNSIMLSICSGKYLPEYESGFNMHSLKLPFVSKKAICSEKDKKLPSFIYK